MNKGQKSYMDWDDGEDGIISSHARREPESDETCRELPVMGNGLPISCFGIAVEDIREIRQIGICHLDFGHYEKGALNTCHGSADVPSA